MNLRRWVLGLLNKYSAVTAGVNGRTTVMLFKAQSTPSSDTEIFAQSLAEMLIGDAAQLKWKDI